MNPTCWPLGLALWLLLPPAAHAAQTVGGGWDSLWHFHDPAGSSFGISASAITDLDGDGITDFAIGDHAGRAYSGVVHVFSGVDGAPLMQIQGGGPWYLGAAIADAGDHDGDGVTDLLVGAPTTDSGGIDTGSVQVYSGSTGLLLLRVDGIDPSGFLGSSVAGMGDVDGDQVPDLLAGAPGADTGSFTDNGAAYLFSGATGGILAFSEGTNDYANHGGSVANVGDLDGDGALDFAVGAYRALDGGSVQSGAAYVYSGASGSLLWQFDALAPADRLGNAVDGAGDADGDGTPDILVGAPWADPNGVFNAGSAYVYSGATGTLLLQFDGNERW